MGNFSGETKYIFLDIDGVLNTSGGYEFNQDCLIRFENAVRMLDDVKIVISSTWRLAFSLKEIRRLFSIDIQSLVVGLTPVHKGEMIENERYYEVLTYLKRKDIKDAKWVAVDDSKWHYPKGCLLILTESLKGFNQASASELVRQFELEYS